jgi:hypothetical protein
LIDRIGALVLPITRSRDYQNGATSAARRNILANELLARFFTDQLEPVPVRQTSRSDVHLIAH